MPGDMIMLGSPHRRSIRLEFVGAGQEKRMIGPKPDPIRILFRNRRISRRRQLLEGDNFGVKPSIGSVKRATPTVSKALVMRGDGEDNLPTRMNSPVREHFRRVTSQCLRDVSDQSYWRDMPGQEGLESMQYTFSS